MSLSKMISSAAIVLTLLLLSGCMGALQTATIIIPDSEEEMVSPPGHELFEIKKIYRLPQSEGSETQLISWSGNDKVLRMIENSLGTQSVQEISFPFERPKQGLELENRSYCWELAPDGRYMAGVAKGSGGYDLLDFLVGPACQSGGDDTIPAECNEY